MCYPDPSHVTSGFGQPSGAAASRAGSVLSVESWIMPLSSGLPIQPFLALLHTPQPLGFLDLLLHRSVGE